MVVDVFKNDPCFNSAIDKAFEVVINQKLVNDPPSKSAEYLSLYYDYLLKKSTKNSKDIDDKLTHSMTMFRHLDNKDVFQTFYQRHLAIRLIHQQNQSIEEEEKVIYKLKVKFFNQDYFTLTDWYTWPMLISSLLTINYK